MTSDRKASTSEFVVRGMGAEALRERAASMPDVEGIDWPADEREPVVLRVSPGKRSARMIFEDLRQTLGEEAQVAPVLEDRYGVTLYPTGRLHVRFETAPAADELARFAKARRLRLRETNRYQPRQACFEPLEPAAEYLPDLIAEIGEASGVVAAWEETRSRYRRS